MAQSIPSAADLLGDRRRVEANSTAPLHDNQEPDVPRVADHEGPAHAPRADPLFVPHQLGHPK